MGDGVLGCDDFDRTVAHGWGSADVGGAWGVFNPQNSAVSVGSGHGSLAVANTMAGTIFHLDTATALDAETHAIVGFDRVPTTGAYYATVELRWVDGNDYVLVLQVLPEGAIHAYINGPGPTTLANGTSSITVRPNAGVELSLVATGASPTMLCGKVWLEGTSEPSECTVQAQDSTPALQAPGLSFLNMTDDGGEAPTVSFSAFRYLRTGPQ
jgi:hypothetical protein